MSRTVAQILEPLGSHWNRIIRRPLSKQELRNLEKRAGLAAPEPLRDFLLHVGLFQDLTHGDFSMQCFDCADDIASAREFIQSLGLTRQADLFPFAHDGAGNIWALSAGETANHAAYFIDHETRKVSRKGTFAAWLEKVVKRVLRGIKRRPLNERKVWCVQFAFWGTEFEELVELLATVGRVRPIDANWSKAKTLSSGVKTSERRLEFNGETLVVERSTCKDWDAPLDAFGMREPLADGRTRSVIKQLDALFKRQLPRYKLVDYGPLDRDALDRT